MKRFRWSAEKNRKLIAERGISFEEVVSAMAHDGLLDELEHPNKSRYPHQRLFVVRVRGYVYLVPFVETSDELFLKTIIPSRKATRIYIASE
ncbi:BrnT family toxin [Methylocystis hirsuta]|uniref:BrnT family toxin n=2 Tax=Methylocystis hirsuta TaxID=369798 RepID=A0A3M9XKK3_9HYPH|nr:BrnT family toxin [Methylocystis hirsuta]